MRKMSDVISNTDLTEIKANQLQNNKILPTDNDSVIELIKMLKKKFLIFLLISLYSFGMMNYICLSGNNESDASPIIAFIVLILFNIFCLRLIVFCLKSLINLKDIDSVKKAQYGNVLSKYYFVDINENSKKHYTYYVNVSFKDKGSYIRHVSCTKEIYESLEVDSPVLVISFNDKQTYCVSKK